VAGVVLSQPQRSGRRRTGRRPHAPLWSAGLRDHAVPRSDAAPDAV